MTRRTLGLTLALAALATLGVSGPARAKPRESYVFLLSRVDLAKGVPAELEAQVTARVNAAIAAREGLESSLAAGAPDPEAAPKKFKEYLKARRKRAFKVSVEVSQFSVEVEQGQVSGRPAQYVTARVTLRLFGETVPDRTMAFTGDGSATVKLEVGKTVRPRDRQEATSSTLDQAVASAIDQSLRRLAQPDQDKKKAGKPGKR
ncbi:MAG TPA: hypothetical protein VK698_24710 [Kofleriaceae bacterium]|nr:hypothetical protein [Kofleriaceae bacterium]